jgi:hypothetical protein
VIVRRRRHLSLSCVRAPARKHDRVVGAAAYRLCARRGKGIERASATR